MRRIEQGLQPGMGAAYLSDHLRGPVEIPAPAERRLWLDPRILPRLAGRQALLVDDVISTGSSALAGLALLERAGVRPAGLLVAMAPGCLFV